MFHLILKHIGKNAIQACSIVTLVASGTLLLFSLVMYAMGAYAGVQLSEERSGADVLLVPKDAASEVSDSALLFTGVPFHMYMGSDVVSQAEGLFGVERVTGQFFAQTLPRACCSTDTATRIVGVDFATDWTLQPLAEKDLSHGLADDEVILGSDVAGNPDGTVNILGKKYRIADRLVPTGSDLDLCIIADIGTVRDLALSTSENDHYWDEYGQPQQVVSAVLVDLRDDLDENGHNRAIAHLKNIGEAKVIERSAAVKQSQESLRTLFGIVLFATALITIIAVLQLFARFSSMAWDRRSEFAIYRMVGATKRHLAALVGGEALILAGIGVVAGLVAGFALYNVSKAQLLANASFPFVAPQPAQIAVVFVAIIALWLVFTLASVWMPLRQVGKISPALVMRENDIV